MPVEETLRSSIDLESITGHEVRRPRLLSLALVADAAAAAGVLCLGLVVPLVVVMEHKAVVDPSWARFAFGQWASVMGSAALGAIVLIGLGLGLVRTARPDRGTFEHRTGWWIGTIVMIGLASVLSFVAASSRVRGPIEIEHLVLGADLALGFAGLGAIVSLSAMLRSLGRRSNRYRRAGRARQPAVPLLTGLGISILLGTTWIALVGGGSGGNIAELVIYTRLVVAGLVLLGGLYLVANAAWATAPFWRGPTSFDQVVALSTDHPPASMADDEPPSLRS